MGIELVYIVGAAALLVALIYGANRWKQRSSTRIERPTPPRAGCTTSVRFRMVTATWRRAGALRP